MSRSRAVLVLVALGAVLFGVSLLTWVRAEANTLLGPVPVAVPGTDAAPVAPTAGLVVLVAGLALGLSGRVVRYVAAAVALLAAAISLISVIGVIADPTPAAESAAAEAGGVPQILGAAQLTAWPWVAGAVAALTVVAAGALPFIAGIWAPVARRYERPGSATSTPAERGPAANARADWDALSRGEDPTSSDPAQEIATGEDPPGADR